MYFLNCVSTTGEADLVLHYVKCLVEAKIEPSDIAVITPYNLQVMYKILHVTLIY